MPNAFEQVLSCILRWCTRVTQLLGPLQLLTQEIVPSCVVMRCADRVVLCCNVLCCNVLCCVAGSVVKTGEIWAGIPAKLLRQLSADEKGFVAASADNYARIATEHK